MTSDIFAPSKKLLGFGKETDDVDFEKYRGMSFQEFWEALPKKLEYFDYEDLIREALQNNKKIRIKKATGLGVTEVMTRWIAWNCVKDDSWKNQQVDVSVIIITGANQELTNKIIGRIKNLFYGEKHFKTREKLAVINGCRIEAFPTNHLEPARGLNPRLVLLDEADFFPARYQDEARTVAERYRIKGDASVVMVSTPNLPGGLYDRMDREEDAGYHLLELNYEYGEGKVFDPETIAKEKTENPSFEREYNLMYAYGLGDIFQGLDDIIVDYDLTLKNGHKECAGDPAFGSSKFGVCAGESLDGVAYVKEAKQYPRPSPSVMLDVMEELAIQYDGHCSIDSAHPGFIRDLQERGIPAQSINFGLQMRDEKDKSKQSLRSKMTINAAQMVRTKKVMVHPCFTELISQLRSAKFDDRGGVDKSELSFDIGDAFIMLCWKMKNSKVKIIRV